MKKTVVCHDIKGAETEVSVDKLKFRPSVYGVLIEDGKVLLSKQFDGYDFPGGGLNIDETLEEGVRREFKEETGLDVKVGDVIYSQTGFFHSSHYSLDEGQYWNCILLYFLVEKTGGEISIDGCDEDEKKYIDLPEWIETEKVKDLKFYNSTDNITVIKKALKHLK